MRRLTRRAGACGGRFFRGALTVDGQAVPGTLFKMVKETLAAQPGNSVIGFNDNSSAIRGGPTAALFPVDPGAPSPLRPTTRDLDLLFTAETHNFPCAVAPYPGAETGAGGRIRDTHATGRGSLVGAATAGYCVGNLRLGGAAAAHEDVSFEYPPNLAAPLQILVEASNGASDYGNKFGEPLIQGFCRSFGQRLPSGERREWLKPIMFSAGVGSIDHAHIEKDHARVGMLVVKLGGPAYRIGLGGGAASSMTSGANDAELDFNAVQRGDAEMAQKLNRVVRTCVEMGPANPILSIHDQGAGGNCNVVKEIIYPGGAEIDIRRVHVGDATMSVMDIWGAEYQARPRTPLPCAPTNGHPPPPLGGTGGLPPPAPDASPPDAGSCVCAEQRTTPHRPAAAGERRAADRARVGAAAARHRRARALPHRRHRHHLRLRPRRPRRPLRRARRGPPPPPRPCHVI